MSGDARLLELELLNRLARGEVFQVLRDNDIPRRDLIVYLLVEGLANDVAGYTPDSQRKLDEARNIMQRAQFRKNKQLVEFLVGQVIDLRISHKGRVRLAELEQTIKTGRERDSFGILWAGRYWERDLRIALLQASAETPVSFCFLDMNGLKAINDKHGHEAGDDAIRTYLRVIADNAEGVGEAYRCGGDEVVVVLPGTNAETAATIMAAVLKQLGEEHVKGVQLTASCGVGVAVSPEVQPKAFREAVDKMQYQAKAASKASQARPSVLAIEGRELQVF